jgi:hypothetical protein
LDPSASDDPDPARVGTAGLIAAVLALPSDQPTDNDEIDPVGSSLLSATMFGLTFGLIEGSSNGWTAGPVASIATGAAMFAAFAFRQRTARNPLIGPSLLANTGFTAGLLLGLVYFAAANGLMYTLALFLQIALGRTPSQTAPRFAPLAVAIIAASFYCRPRLARPGRRVTIVRPHCHPRRRHRTVGHHRHCRRRHQPWAITPAIMLLGLGPGACFSSIYDIAVGDLTPDEAGSASGSLSAVRQLAAAIGAAVVTSIYFGQADRRGPTHAHQCRRCRRNHRRWPRDRLGPPESRPIRRLTIRKGNTRGASGTRSDS